MAILDKIFGADLNSILAPLQKIDTKLQAFVEKINAEKLENTKVMQSLAERNAAIDADNIQAATVSENIKKLLGAV